MAKQKNNELNLQNEALQKKLRLSSIVIVLLVITLCTVTIVYNNRPPRLPAPAEPAALPGKLLNRRAIRFPCGRKGQS